MGFVRAVVLDLDGTLTLEDRIPAEALHAIAGARDDGVAVVLATGRILAELDGTFPGLATRFDVVVAENGGVLQMGGEIHDLAAPVEPDLLARLERRHIGMRRGRVLLAGAAADAEAVLDAVGELELDCQLVRNRGALMVLPAGVSKGTGLLAALGEPHGRTGDRPALHFFDPATEAAINS